MTTVRARCGHPKIKSLIFKRRLRLLAKAKQQAVDRPALSKASLRPPPRYTLDYNVCMTIEESPARKRRVARRRTDQDRRWTSKNGPVITWMMPGYPTAEAPSAQKPVTYFTDGSCQPNPGPGGWAVVKNMKLVAEGSESWTTNNRMEGQAIIAAMKLAAGTKCRIYTDSQFWVNVITVWSTGWQKNGWHKKGGEIKNLDLVQEAHRLYRSSKGNAQLVWVRGHDGNRGNEQADRYAESARRRAGGPPR